MKTRAAGVAMAVLLAAAAWCPGQTPPLPGWLLPVNATDIDFAACRAFVDDKPVPGEAPRAAVLATLGLGGGGDMWSAGPFNKVGHHDYVIAFRRPLAAGSILFQGQGRLWYLKADAAAADPANSNAWSEVVFPPLQSKARLAALPPGTQTRALLCSVQHDWSWRWDRLEMVRLLIPRWHNIVPDGIGNGEAEYTLFHPDARPPIHYTAANLVNGSGSWQSHGVRWIDKRIPRAPVSDIDPTWFVLSWEKPQTVCTVRLASNFKSFKLLAYTGVAGVNPAVAPDRDWKRVKYEAQPYGGALWLSLPPLTTRGLKFLVEATTDPQFGAIGALHAFVDLKDAPAPVRAPAAGETPPFAVAFTVPGDGTFSMGIDAPDGRRVKNVVVREERKAGTYRQPWDLMDEAGAFVEPGTYRWKGIWHPGLTLKYEMTPYPNVAMNAPSNSPWLNGVSGPGGWMADHSAPLAACAVGDRVFFAAGCAESGAALIECDLDGRKRWGYGNLLAWSGPHSLASDGQALFAAAREGEGDYVCRFTLPEKSSDVILQQGATPTRQRGIRGMAARGGKLYLAVNAGENRFENAATPGDVDIEQCVPRYSPGMQGDRPDSPYPRNDFLRLFRLAGTPPGCNGLMVLETDTGVSPAPRQHIMLALNKAVPVGSFAFPLPEDRTLNFRLSLLKEGAALPPDPGREEDWNVIWKGTGAGWMVVPAPTNATARAVRLSFDNGLGELADIMAGVGAADGTEADFGLGKREALPGLDQRAWKGQIDGMKILRRRYASLFPSCKVSVNSGKVTPDGEWDAQRARPLTRADPAVYMMSWKAAQPIHGLAIKEIDGRITEIDAWTGEGEPVLDGERGWEQVATYEQPTRSYYVPDQNFNARARYVDGYVDFGREVRVRALRLRIVEQWMWKEEGRAGCAGVRWDRAGEKLEPARCHVYGVAPLQYLGGETPVEALKAERLEIYDVATRKLVKELPLERGGDLAFAPDGTLYAVSGARVVKIDPDKGRHAPFRLDVKQPGALACDRAGNLFVCDTAENIVKVFNPAGKLVRRIGNPAPREPGPHDPTRLANVRDLAVDEKDQLWMVEEVWVPRRITQWGADGTFKREFLGNTGYGGGGALNPHNKRSLFYGPVEFDLDWRTGRTRLKNIASPWDSPPGEAAIKVRDRLYVVSRQTFDGLTAEQPVGAVYLYQTNRLRRVAAVGAAGRFLPLRTPEIIGKLGAKALGSHQFAWSDLNGDEKAQVAEVQFFETARLRGGGVGRFDDDLGTDAGDHRYDVERYLPNGVPIYARTKKKFSGGSVRTFDGRNFLVWNDHMGVVTDEGKPVWTHPTEAWGVFGQIDSKSWFPGQTVAQFGVVGHETVAGGDLGEFFVTHSTHGRWHIWTADGLLAGSLFRDLRAGGRPWSMPEHERGMDLSDVKLGGEHWAGYFCRTREDNKFYAVAGHNHISVVEVQGLEKFKRMGGEIKVSREDVAAAMQWDRQRQARRLYEAAKIIECRRSRNEIIVNGEATEWDESARLKDRQVSFGMAYNDANLYVYCVTKGVGPLKNTGNDWRRLFKTGAAVDLQIGVDPKASPDRKAPVQGDQRVLLTVAEGKPVAVLYQAVAPDARPEEAWEARTQVCQARFARVARLAGAVVAVQTGGDYYCLEASIPLAALGLRMEPDLTLKMDWGILVSGPDGTEVMQRLYWANSQTGIVSDEAAEAMLRPDLWGSVRFIDRRAPKGQPELGEAPGLDLYLDAMGVDLEE